MEKENPHVMVCYFIFMFNYNNNAKLVMVIWVIRLIGTFGKF